MQYCFGGCSNSVGAALQFSDWIQALKVFMDLELSAGLDVAF